MTKKMLIDATHDEETRVAVVENNRLIEFDYESKVRKQLKGNIYLAKVTRVEPSLQAAFVNFGGNRHGFLPFSEIHPDYFKIPVDDREALLEAQKAALEEHDEIFNDEELDDEIVEPPEEVDEAGAVEEIIDEDQDDIEEVGGADKPAAEDDSDLKEPVKKTRGRKKTTKKSVKKDEEEKDISLNEDQSSEEDADKKTTKAKKRVKKSVKKTSKKDEDSIGNIKKDEEEKSDEELDAEAQEKLLEMDNSEDGKNNTRGKGRKRYNNRGRGKGRSNMSSRRPAKYGGKGRSSGKPFRFNLHHRYKIQEVVKRGQIMLIQVSKEERGNKGAAVTSYLSLPGRYCVLMPNSPRGGGVSRKIGHFKDRRKMRDILKELTVPEGMSVILRTAGVSRTKEDIKRDLDYLTRLWNTIREETLQSSAPALINEEGNLIKRSIRDIYTRDVEVIEVAGEKGYKSAKKNMKLLVPSHAKKVHHYKDEKIPLFHKFQVERQIADIGETTATLKSGGYLVINPTEALVSIDVNSGKATKERHIEETALKTNLEAADEVARQLRLRDLGGLVVIDFIDMEDRRNNRKVEQRLKDALSVDRARIQVGRISSFGLLELSRQRLNPSLTEAQFELCAHCEGRGFTMTLDFAAITALRGVEEQGISGKAKEVSLCLPNDVAVYILNKKRDMLSEIEKRHEFKVHINVDEALRPSEYRIDILADDGSVVESKSSKQKQEIDTSNNVSSDDGDSKKKGRRRGRRGGRRRNNNDNKKAEDLSSADSLNENEKSLSKNSKKEISEDKNNSDKIDNKKDDKTSDKKDRKKSDKKDGKKIAKKKSSKPTKKDKSPKPSNDSNNIDSNPVVERDSSEYEVVNAPPKTKKKGWWNRLVE